MDVNADLQPAATAEGVSRAGEGHTDRARVLFGRRLLVVHESGTGFDLTTLRRGLLSRALRTAIVWRRQAPWRAGPPRREGVSVDLSEFGRVSQRKRAKDAACLRALPCWKTGGCPPRSVMWRQRLGPPAEPDPTSTDAQSPLSMADFRSFADSGEIPEYALVDPSSPRPAAFPLLRDLSEGSANRQSLGGKLATPERPVFGSALGCPRGQFSGSGGQKSADTAWDMWTIQASHGKVRGLGV